MSKRASSCSTAACERLTRLARKMLKDFGRVRRWEETDDVVQNALLRLYRTLAKCSQRALWTSIGWPP